MSMKKRPWFYISIAGIVFSLGAIAYSIISGETVMVGKFALVLVLSLYFFARELRLRRIEVSQSEDKTTQA